MILGRAVITFLIGALMGYDARGMYDNKSHKIIPLVNAGLKTPAKLVITACPCVGEDQCFCDNASFFDMSNWCSVTECDSIKGCKSATVYCPPDSNLNLLRTRNE